MNIGYAYPFCHRELELFSSTRREYHLAESWDWIEKLKLLPHPEGGFYREAYRSAESIEGGSLPKRFASGSRPFGTSIYYLLTGNTVSRLHRVNQDETWHFYDGSGLLLHVIDPRGMYRRHRVGIRLDAGELPQFTVKAGCFFGAEVSEENSFSLVGCTCCPGFTFHDLFMPAREEALAMFPHLKDTVLHLIPEAGI